MTCPRLGRTHNPFKQMTFRKKQQRRIQPSGRVGPDAPVRAHVLGPSSGHGRKGRALTPGFKPWLCHGPEFSVWAGLIASKVTSPQPENGHNPPTAGWGRGPSGLTQGKARVDAPSCGDSGQLCSTAGPSREGGFLPPKRQKSRGETSASPPRQQLRWAPTTCLRRVGPGPLGASLTPFTPPNPDVAALLLFVSKARPRKVKYFPRPRSPARV